MTREDAKKQLDDLIEKKYRAYFDFAVREDNEYTYDFVSRLEPIASGVITVLRNGSYSYYTKVSMDKDPSVDAVINCGLTEIDIVLNDIKRWWGKTLREEFGYKEIKLNLGLECPPMEVLIKDENIPLFEDYFKKEEE